MTLLAVDFSHVPPPALSWRPGLKPASPVQAFLSQAIGLIRAVPTGRLLVEQAEAAMISICAVDATREANPWFDHGARLIALPLDTTADGGLRGPVPADRAAWAIGALIHELRHAWQHSAPGLFDYSTFRPFDTVFLRRVIEADASAVTARVLWELAGQGFPAPLDNFRRHSAGRDLAGAFLAGIRPGTAPGPATAAAFAAWFADETRVAFYDRHAIDHELWRLSREGIGARSGAVTADIVARIGRLGGGESYLVADATLVAPARREGFSPAVKPLAERLAVMADAPSPKGWQIGSWAA